MKNKTIIISILFLIFFQVSYSQNQVLTLKECINLALENKNNIKAIQLENEIETLKTIGLNANYWPQISLAYEYRYNPIIRSNILPVGQFNAIPTNETRAVKFGTKFQQTGGLSVLQPLFNATISSKIKENKIVEKINQTDLKIAKEALVYEVSKSFINVMLLQKQIKISELDTVRTWKTLQFSESKFKNGVILKTEFNKSKINHNNTLLLFKNNVNQLVNETIYLSFLIGKSYSDFSIKENDDSLNLNLLNNQSTTKSNPSIEKLQNQNILLEQQILSQNKKFLPSVSLNGYLAGDQFADTFSPFLANSWYPNSYIGLNAKWDILNGENFRNKKLQFKLEKNSNDFKIKDISEELDKNSRIAQNEIQQLKTESDFLDDNVKLYKDNLAIIQLRLNQGQASINDVNNEEIEYQKENQKLQNAQIKLWLQWLEYIRNIGALEELYINKLK
jgi:outer membrane protein TolC